MSWRAGSKAAQELLHFGVIARFHKQKAIGAVLENQSDVQSHGDFKKNFPSACGCPNPDDEADGRVIHHKNYGLEAAHRSVAR